MGLIRIATTGGYTATSSSQSNIGTASELGADVRCNGDFLLNGAAAGSAFLWIWNGAGAYRMRFRVGNSAGTVTVQVMNSTTQAAALTYASASITGASFYIVRGYLAAAGHLIGLYASDGTELATGTGAGGAISNTGSSYGAILIGSPTGGTTGDVDAVAIYSGAPTNTIGAEPTTGDTGILAYWAVTDAEAGTTNAANSVGGGVALDTFSNASVVTGGSWNGAGAPSTNIKAIANYYRRLRAR